MSSFTPLKPPQLPEHLLHLPPFDSATTPRLKALYSDFGRQRHSNPTSFNANVDWWRKAFENLVSSGLQNSGNESSRLALNAQREFPDRVRIPSIGKPIGFAAVFAELMSMNILMLQSTFLSLPKPIYDPGPLAYRMASLLIGKPLWWALEQTGIVGEDSYVSNLPVIGSSNSDSNWYGTYIVVPLLERAAERVLDLEATSGNDGLYSVDSFKEKFSETLLSENPENPPTKGSKMREDDAKSLLKFLERDRKCIVIDGDVVKFIQSSVLPDARIITAVDRGILELRTAVSHLHAQVDDLQQRIAECTEKASQALKASRKPIALSHLRIRKQLEDLLSKRLGALDNLESTLISVEAARGDVEIMQTYQASTATLRNILSHPTLQQDSIDETMDALAEANSDAKEVDQAVRDGGEIAIGAVVDDDELADELAELAKENVSDVEQKQERKVLDQTLAKEVEKWDENAEVTSTDHPTTRQLEIVPA